MGEISSEEIKASGRAKTEQDCIDEKGYLYAVGTLENFILYNTIDQSNDEGIFK